MPELKINGYPAIMMMQRGKRGKVINYDSDDFDYRSLQTWLWLNSEVYQEFKQS
jgi:hypothetical protein